MANVIQKLFIFIGYFCLVNYFIINPNAGTNKVHQFKALIKLIEQIKEHKVLLTNKPQEATTLANQAIQNGASRIIAVGGDGTINEVAKALVNTQIPLGIIPIGSGNGLARHLKIPLKHSAALHLATNGPVQKMDVCYLNEQCFFCTAGIGFDASVAQKFAQGKGRGLINYIKATLATLSKYKPIMVSINNGPMEEVFSLTIANANQFGNNAYISPLSNVQDGQLEIVKINKIGLFNAFFIAIRLFLGNIHKSNNVTVITSNNINIKYQTGAPFHLDGESLITSNEQLTITIKPLYLNVIC